MHNNDLVAVSRADLERLLSFALCQENAFDELNALFAVIREGIENTSSVAYRLAGIGLTHSATLSDGWMEEGDLMARLGKDMEGQYKGDSNE